MNYVGKSRYWLFIFSIFFAVNANANFSLNPYLGGLADSSAGGAAVNNDATAAFTNPAGLTHLSGQQWVLHTLAYRPSVSFENKGSTDVLSNPNDTGNGGDAGSLTAIPSFYYSNRLNDKLGLGFSVNAPFGLSSEYDETWTGRYHAIKTSIETMTLTTSLGYKVSTQWSIGVGAHIQNTKADLSSALDFGAICLGALDPTTCASLNMPGPQSADGKVEHNTDDWAAGFSIGTLWTKNETQIGFSYRSKVEHELKGDARYTTPSSAFAPIFTNTDVSVELTLPEIASLNIQHAVTPKLTVLAGTTLTRWSRIKQLNLDYANPVQDDQTVPKNWKDVWRKTFGLHYAIKPNWKITGGVARENSNIPNETFEPGIPTSDATWVNIGTTYQWRNDLDIQFAWSHVFFDKRKINRVSAFGDTLQGEIDLELDVLLLQINRRL